MKKLVKLFLENMGLRVMRTRFDKDDLTKNKVIFIHVPKVAGTGLQKSLGFSVGHTHLYIYELKNRKNFNEYFKIGFVRNPWDRLVSAFFYIKQGGNKSDYDLMLKDKLERVDTFEKFVLELDNNIEFRKEILNIIVFSSQYCWLMNLMGEVGVDYVGRFENLEEDFLILKEKLHRKDAKLKKHNTSNHKPYWTYYNEETVEIVRKIYSKDVIAFNYDFPYEKLQSENK